MCKVILDILNIINNVTEQQPMLDSWSVLEEFAFSPSLF